MAVRDIIMGIIFISHTVAGVLGNSYLLSQHLLLYITGKRVRSTDLIVVQLIVANFLTLLCKGIPQAMTALGMRVFLGDVGCKLLFYLHGVGRSVCIGSTCLLSVYQAITISPDHSSWAELKAQATRYIVWCLSLTWILSLLVNTSLLVYMTGKWINDSRSHGMDFGYCDAMSSSIMVTVLYSAVMSIPDVLGVVLMLCTSGSMVSTLYRHKQRMKQMPRNNVSLERSACSRAAKTILHLVITFVFFYTLSCMCKLFIMLTFNPSWLLVNMGTIAAGFFPCISPFLLMRCKYQVCSDKIRHMRT